MQTKKTPKADLERKKFIFIQIGLVIALSICFLAFEWSSPDVNLNAFGNPSMGDDWELDIESTIHDDDIPEPEPEPEPEFEEVFDELVVVDDEAEVDNNVDFDSEAREDTKTTFHISGFTTDDEVEELDPIPFAAVENKPEFPGGEETLLRFIASNTKYPDYAKNAGIDGRVFVQFIISATGQVTNVEIARGADPHLDREAVRVVRTIPAWKPGTQRGQPVPVIYIIPISFVLE